MQSFEQSYKRLNKQQRQAVDAIEGAVLVIAGPGTGKTELLAMRVANILHQTDSQPDNILCLTFTSKAALNMRQRLISLIGPEGAKVNVKTFHSFGAEIMNLYPEYFWNGARLDNAPAATQLQIVEGILSTLDIKNPLALRFGGQFTVTRDVISALQMAKEAGLTPAKLKSLVKLNLKYIHQIEPTLVDIANERLNKTKLEALAKKIDSLPIDNVDALTAPIISLGSVIRDSFYEAHQKDEQTGRTTNLSRWKNRWLQTVGGKKGMFKERERNEWWLTLADVYASYRELMHKRGLYDYADMIVEVITQLENNPVMLADVQERFNYILIDEFQDTNSAQLRLAHLVADHYSANQNPNIMAVGDDDQAIFRFNGAELDNALSFKRSYPMCQVIVLTKNYRSTQKLLDFSSQIIGQASDRLIDRLDNLTKNLVANSNDIGTDAQIKLFSTRSEQLHTLAQDIKLAASKQDASEIAVLARNHESLRQLAAHLTRLGVPVRYERQSNILEDPIVRQVIGIVEIIEGIRRGDNALVSANLSRLLLHEAWQLKPQSLWQLATAGFDNDNWLNNMLLSRDKRLQDLAEWLLWLTQQGSDQPLPVFMELALGLRQGVHLTSPLNTHIADRLSLAERLQTLSALRVLKNLADEFSSPSSASLASFLEFIKLNANNNEVISDQSTFVSGHNAVQLLTVHKAKGLEFDTVYVIDAIDKNWRPSVHGRKPPANLPLQRPGDTLDDYARLMYVATTRAKRRLVITAYTNDDNNEPLLVSPLIGPISLETISPRSAKESINILESDLRWPQLTASDERAVLKDRLTNFTLSSTSLLDYIDLTQCGPQKFYEKYILRLPQLTSPQMAYGTAIHAALEAAQNSLNKGKLDIESSLAAYQLSLRRQNLTSQDYLRYLKYGQDIIKDLLTANKLGLTKGSHPEQKIMGITLGRAKLSGKLDRVDVLRRAAINIVDYKTGKPPSSLDSKSVKAWRHKTQLIFYALLARHSSRYQRAKDVTGQLIYIESSGYSSKKYVPTEQDILDLSNLIDQVWRRIMRLDFPDISAYKSNLTGVQDFIANLSGKE